MNLHAAAVRLLVVKKNSTRLAKLVSDLKKIGSKALSEVPSLIIDDESDQASVDTIRPDKRFLEAERRRRSTINQRVTDLLQILPRAQYVGYTATPFANVFVDPEDAENIFPKDFIISLPRPAGYMGVSDFHDLDKSEDDDLEGPGNPTRRRSSEGVWEPHDESTDQLLRAIDTFVLTGAIKLYRERLGTPKGHAGRGLTWDADAGEREGRATAGGVPQDAGWGWTARLGGAAVGVDAGKCGWRA